ncbi:MAG TPA: sugar-binding domain-containing protein, partial [Ktedonobacteraceae bacterium]|nr:sugar-binding domain-containing protein [Ktedonobacteraceae bacterium]
MPEILQGNTTEARLLADERFLRKIAYLYYEDGNSQEAVAEIENCSRQTVGKALQKARERGIVRISVMPDLRTGYLRNLSRDVRVQLGLEDLVLVAGRNINAPSSEETLDDVVTDISTAAAEYLDQLLTDNDILAVSGGKQFMRGLMRHLNPSGLLPQLQVVATIGFVQPRTSYGDANLIAFDLAEAYGASHMWFPCPAFLPDQEQLHNILQLPTIKEAHDLMNLSTVVVTSLFTTHKDTDLIRSGVISPRQLEVFDTYNPVADINHWVFDAEGRCIND